MSRNIITYLRHVLKKPTSDSFLKRYGLVHSLLYRDLARCRSLADVFQGHDHCLLLYPDRTETDGHWTLLIPRGQGFEYFCSYGKPPDFFLKKSAEPYLSQLMQGERVIWNNFPFQRHDNSVASCGQWCALRYTQKRMSIHTFQQCFGLKNISLTRDEFVCLVI